MSVVLSIVLLFIHSEFSFILLERFLLLPRGSWRINAYRLCEIH